MKPGDHIPAGTLNLLVALYSPALDSNGEESGAPVLIASGIPAAKRTMRGREVEGGERTVAEQYAVFTIRYRSGLDAAKVLTHGGDRWDIETIDNVNGSNRRLDITARLIR